MEKPEEKKTKQKNHQLKRIFKKQPCNQWPTDDSLAKGDRIERVHGTVVDRGVCSLQRYGDYLVQPSRSIVAGAYSNNNKNNNNNNNNNNWIKQLRKYRQIQRTSRDRPRQEER